MHNTYAAALRAALPCSRKRNAIFGDTLKIAGFLLIYPGFMLNSLSAAIPLQFTGNEKKTLLGLKGSSLACLLARNIEAGAGPFLIIAPSSAEAEKLLGDLRFFLGEKKSVHFFPHWEVLPYETLSPHPAIVSERIKTLYALATEDVQAVITTVPSVMQRVMPKSVITDMPDYLVAGEEIPFDRFLERLVERGYARTLHVEEMGEFSVRGGIVDVFGPAMNFPVRIEFFGDEVESIREFSPENQKSTGVELEELIILPAGEVYLNLQKKKELTRVIRIRGIESGVPREPVEEILASIREGIPFQGMEFFLPDFYPECASFFDYLPEKTVIVRLDNEELLSKAGEFEKSFTEGYEKSRAKGWPFPEPERLYYKEEFFRKKLDQSPSLLAGGVSIGETEAVTIDIENNHDIRALVSSAQKGKSPLEPLVSKINEWRSDGISLFLAAHTRGQAERLSDLLKSHGLCTIIRENPPDFREAGEAIPLYTGDLSAGFKDLGGRFILITEEDIFGERHKRRGRLKKAGDLRIASFGQLKGGDYIVHVDHGIGVYRGLNKLEAGGTIGDYLELEYLGGDKVFLPVDRLNLVQRYAAADNEVPRLDKLGGASWEKVKKRVKKAVTEMAGELLEIHAAREVMKGHAYAVDSEEFSEFEASFEYEETTDQKNAIDDVIADMKSRRPMDRLVCGDVGYGKTEVAVRAAFVAAMEGRQAAVLVPTTLLAQQHYQTFCDRFKGYPIVVERLTRFCSAARQKEVVKRLEEGKVDLIIGTHRLLQKDVKFRNLGLVVIDEEQRFGVAHKEKLKKIRKTVDVLTLTATPIPRTLHMSMMGIRDLSIISSPPEGRLAIRTFVTNYDEEVIREAVMRELRRGGQVFFVHNKVQDIENVAASVREIVPEARIAIAHGQMHEHELEKVMLEFDEGEKNLLICTTIIESGLDIPNANTIVIHNAQSMGLAQLYQLRGRVGRSKHRAYAYLLVPTGLILTKEARKRLQAIQEMKELSSGFQLASYDLEIRGAGNIVGAEQSGNIEAVGFELFSSMLEKAVAELKGELLKEEIEPEIRFPCPAYLSEDYVADANQRLNLYKRFSSLSDEEELDEMKPELLDRFGPIPAEALNFIELISLKILLKQLMIREAVISEKALSFTFHEKAPVNVDKLLTLVNKSPSRYAITPDRRFKIRPSSGDWLEALREGKKVLKGLVECGNF